MKNITLFIIISFPHFLFSQQWHAYSDSITKITSVKHEKKDLEKANKLIELAEKDIEKNGCIKDTIYADYLYRKGFVKYQIGQFTSQPFEESISIWNKSPKKNYLKLSKVHYFLADGYNVSEDYSNAYVNYEKCYFINKQFNLKNNIYFSNSVYCLSVIDYKENFNFKKAKQYAIEYIELNKETAYLNFDFNYAYAFIWKVDSKGYENVLLDFNNYYVNKNINNPELYFQINYDLFGHYYRLKNVKEIIKYGEASVELTKTLKNNTEQYLKELYPRILWAYREIGDNINIDKYEKLCDLFPNESIGDEYYRVLDKIYRDKDPFLFKTKFEEFENNFKNQNNYNKLVELYHFFLGEKKIDQIVVFTDDDILIRINYINKLRNKLTKINILKFDLFAADFYMHIKRYYDSLKICNENLNTNDVKSKLEFYKIKYWCEEGLGNFNEQLKVAYEAYEVFKINYGEDDPRILPFLIRILNANHIGNEYRSAKIVTKTLNILYANKLENTQASVRAWDALGQFARFNNNIIDAINYFEKSIKIQEQSEIIGDEYLFYNSLSRILYLKVTKTEDDDWEIYSKKLENFLLKYPDFQNSILGELNLDLGDINLIRLKFSDAIENYDLAFSILGEKKSKMYKFNYIICKYFVKKNIPETIKSLEDFQKDNINTNHISNLIYLLKYSSGDFLSARKHLIDQLEKLIWDNYQYFHLLSGYEKEKLFEIFSDQFEFLNGYLPDADSSFIKKYIDLRFYSKSLLFSSSLISGNYLENDKKLFNELKNNINQINILIENKTSNLKLIEDIKFRNREIEKLLSVNKKNISAPSLKDLSNKINQGDAYVEIVRINKQSKNKSKQGIEILEKFTDSISYGAIVIKKNSTPKFILIDNSNQLEKEYASGFKSKILNKQEDNESYHLLFEKIDDELKDIKKIYLVTDGIYNSINIESIYNPTRKQYLIDYLKIQSIQNVRAITDDKKEFKLSSTTKAVLFGNPDFDLLITDVKTDNFSLERGLENTDIDKIKSIVKIGRLNGTQKEIETLDAILKDSKSTVELFSKSNATEDNLKNIQSPDILHIATHGYFLSNNDTSKTKQSIANLINENYKDDSYLKSGLLLAGVQNTLNGKQVENSNNGILTAEEAKSLNLKNTELVVLSACETGLGDNLVGEGVIGLQRAFMIAGAKSVIMSLWSVSDEKTQELMTLFYTNWIKNNLSKEEALYQAKIEMKKLYPQPYYWAGFVLLE